MGAIEDETIDGAILYQKSAEAFKANPGSPASTGGVFAGAKPEICRRGGFDRVVFWQRQLFVHVRCRSNIQKGSAGFPVSRTALWWRATSVDREISVSMVKARVPQGR